MWWLMYKALSCHCIKFIVSIIIIFMNSITKQIWQTSYNNSSYSLLAVLKLNYYKKDWVFVLQMWIGDGYYVLHPR